MRQNETDSARTFGIGAVARITGLSDHTIRIWERRYDAVVAERGANGRRIYTAEDIEKLNLLRVLTEQGHSIGSIAGDTVEELTARVASGRALSAVGRLPVARIAVLGEFVAPKLSTLEKDAGAFEVVVSDSNMERFVTDVAEHPVDVLVVEFPVIGSDTAKRIHELLAAAGAKTAVLIYRFGRSSDLEALRHAGALLLRAPVTSEELRAVIAMAIESGTGIPKVAVSTKRLPSRLSWEATAEIAPRRFSQRQLATLSAAASNVQCECPQQLAQLVTDLGAFENYSAQCANRDEKDAELHRYLHHTTAAARALIEESLERVALAEGITY